MGGDAWNLDTHDVTVEFYCRDLAQVLKVIADPDFQALRADEEPWIDDHKRRGGAGASVAWVEVYVEDGKVVNIDEDGKPEYGSLDVETELNLS
jgi:hypothetical protein